MTLTANNSFPHFPLAIKSIYLWTPEEQHVFSSDSSGEANSWKLPVIEEIPKREQRRFNQLSRIALYSALQCTRNENRDNLTTVLASRHGDMSSTLDIFSDIAEQQPVSPHQFSGSVLNIPFAYYSIFFNDKQPSTAVSSSTLLFSFGFLEAVMNLHRIKTSDVLYTCADLPLDGALENYNDLKAPYSVSLILSTDLASGKTLDFRYNSETGDQKTHDQIPDAFTFYNWFIGEEDKELSLQQNGNHFFWKKSL